MTEDCAKIMSFVIQWSEYKRKSIYFFLVFLQIVYNEKLPKQDKQYDEVNNLNVEKVTCVTVWQYSHNAVCDDDHELN